MAQSSCRVCVLGAESSVMWGGTLRPVVSRATRAKYVRFGTLRVRCAEGEGRLNPSIKKDLEKVVDTVVAGELSKPLTPYCRCWRSETFPLCDGSHVKHNKATGDNVGPLLLKK